MELAGDLAQRVGDIPADRRTVGIHRHRQLAQLVANWLSWIVNLLIAEWWLERTDIAARNKARRAARG